MRARRHPERGSSIVIALVVMSALGTLAILTVRTVRGGLATTANDRFHAIALYAAESGGAAAIDFLRATMSSTTRWSAYVEPGAAGHVPSGVIGNGAAPGDAGNPFSPELLASYDLVILNNRGDPGYTSGDDTDGRVIIRSTGHGPDGAVAIIEWEVTADAVSTTTPCNVYAQKSQTALNDGTNPCLGSIDTSVTATFTP